MLQIILLTTLFHVAPTPAIEGEETFAFLTTEADVKKKQITVKTVHEKEPYSFFVEQYVNDEWEVIHHFSGRGVSDTSEYNIPIDVLVQGENRFRIRRESDQSYFYYSDIIRVENTKSSVAYHYNARKNQLVFSSNVYYDLQAENIGVFKEGVSKRIDLNALKKGLYTLWYNNRLMMIKVDRKGDVSIIDSF